MTTREQLLGFDIIAAVVVLVVAGAVPALGATCNVPSTPHPTIQAAINDVACTEIVAATGTYTEAPVINRTLSIEGAGSSQSFIQGQVEVLAGTVGLTGLHISAAGEALWAHSGAETSGFDLIVVNGLVGTPLFADGFEDGTTNAWSNVSP